ncbi:hypothetical protein ANACOL_00585 [Anaerotruncus colihominis DSM 17241]|uniref:Uncharacterized protein n=1 Tax=Anaerotruncus colihominis DSM 17241 TaxID=445972 RepID=B0P757_9FIRM|nr:hypothetical protein ANACOL_00585 [Anaerotruncus colihominis DSM 17241]
MTNAGLDDTIGNKLVIANYQILHRHTAADAVYLRAQRIN